MTTIVRQYIGGYILPNRMFSEDDMLRADCADIPAMSGREIAAERHAMICLHSLVVRTRSRLRVDVSEYPHSIPVADWAEERIAKIDAEIRFRRRAGVRS